MPTSVPGLLSVEEKADGKDPGIGWSREFQNPTKVGWCSCCENHDWCKGKNPLTAKRSLNFLLNPSLLIKRYFITPIFLGVWKSCDQPMPGSFPAGLLLLNGEKPWEWGWSLCELFLFILVTRVLVLCIRRGWFSSPGSEVVGLLETRLPVLRSSLNEENGCILFLSGMTSSISNPTVLLPRDKLSF